MGGLVTPPEPHLNADPELRALWAAVRADPDDDTPRLVLADWLQERGADDRAELIRVQCELARTDPAHVTFVRALPNHSWTAPTYARIARLCARERALLTARSAEWRKGPACPACTEPRGECPVCDGSGDAGGLLRTERIAHWHAGRPVELITGTNRVWTEYVSYVRGSKVVHWPLQYPLWILRSEIFEPAPDVRRICAGHPDVTELAVRWFPVGHGVTAREESYCVHARDVPPQLREEFAGAWFPTRERALTVLGRALVRWAHAFEKGE